MGTLRVIAGEYRGRRIAVPGGVHVRPTADRVREALFNILGAEVTGFPRVGRLRGKRGPGLRGVEPWGFGRPCFLESDRRAWLGLQRQRGGAGSPGALHTSSAAESVELIDSRRGPGSLPDSILADPPYTAGEAAAFLPAAARLLGPARTDRSGAGRAHPAAGLPAPAGLELQRTARYGRCCLDFFGAGSASAGPG